MPYLYHATSRATADLIMAPGGSLECRSGVAPNMYLCMSATQQGAVTLNPTAGDIIFRVWFPALPAPNWVAAGAGLQEWRGTVAIPNTNLEYRRSLGTPVQTTWRPGGNYPAGL
jgi:hypothetical protein